MFSTKVAVLALATGSAGLVGAGAFHAHGGRFGHGHGEMFHKFVDFAINERLDAIGATPAQKEKVRAVKDRLMTRAHALHAEHAAVHQEVVALLEQDDPDPAQIKAVAHARIAKLTEFVDDAADALVEVHNVFTPEQRRKLMTELKEHMAAHERN